MTRTPPSTTTGPASPTNRGLMTRAPDRAQGRLRARPSWPRSWRPAPPAEPLATGRNRARARRDPAGPGPTDRATATAPVRLSIHLRPTVRPPARAPGQPGGGGGGPAQARATG